MHTVHFLRSQNLMATIDDFFDASSSRKPDTLKITFVDFDLSAAECTLLSQKSATVADNGETTATVALFCDPLSVIFYSVINLL